MTIPRAQAGLRVAYLHGFAAGKQSSKATFLRSRLSDRGVSLECPDLNEPDFSTLTITRMLEQVGKLIEQGPTPITLIGSSLGGAVAILAAERFRSRVDRLVLLAPAVRVENVVELAESATFPKGEGSRSERIDEWRGLGSLQFRHFGDDAKGVLRPLNFSFYEDSVHHDPQMATITQCTLAFHGFEDETVPYPTVEQFARERRKVELCLRHDDHRLKKSKQFIWNVLEPFLELA